MAAGGYPEALKAALQLVPASAAPIHQIMRDRPDMLAIPSISLLTLACDTPSLQELRMECMSALGSSSRHDHISCSACLPAVPLNKQSRYRQEGGAYPAEAPQAGV